MPTTPNISSNLGIGTTNPTSQIHGVDTLNAATGNEIAYRLDYTTNKATSGNDTGLLIAMTDSVSPGTSLLLDAQVGAASKFSVDNSGNITASGTINNQTIGATSSMANLNLSGDLTVTGNLTVNGTQTILNVETVEVESNAIKMNRNITGAPSLNASITVERGTSADTSLRWNEASDVWDLTKDGTNYYTILDSNTSFAGDVTGTASTTVVGDDSHAHTSTTLPAATSYLGNSIGTAEIEADAITSAKITDGTIVAADLASGSIIKSKLNELRPHEQATPNNTAYVEPGIVSVANNAKLTYAGGNSPAFTAVDSGNSRIDLLTIDSSGVIGITLGTQGSSPTPPTYPTDKLVIAEVTVTETGTALINNIDILDVRPFLNLGTGSGASSIDSTIANTFTLDNDNTGGNVTLKYGNTANETLIWNPSAGEFQLSDDLNVTGTLTATNLAGPTSTSGTSNDSFEIDSDDSSTQPTLTFGANASASPRIITQVGPLTLQPVSGSGVNISLSTTGDFAVNTNQLYVDTSAGNVGIGTTGPGAKLEVAGGDVALAANQKLKLEGSVGDTYIEFDSTNNWMRLYVNGVGVAKFKQK